jgi:hypothetical protein
MNSFKRTMVLFLCLFSIATTTGQVRDSILNLDKKDDRNQPVISTKDNYLFVYDGLYDMNGSAQNLLSVSHLFGRSMDELICSPDKNTGLNYCLEKENIFGRLLIDFGLNFIFSTWLAPVQHEFMGHGFRAREFNARINSYTIVPFWMGNPRLDIHREDLPYYGLLIEEAGGCESNTIFAREAYRQSLLNDYFYHYYVYSFLLKIDLPTYIFVTPKVGSYEWLNNIGGLDVVRYIKAFKSKSKDDEQQIYNSALKGAYWSLADPSLLISLYNYFKDFIIDGKSKVKNPMIQIDNVSFLPYTDFHLSPFGYEYYAGTYLKYNKTLYEAYYRWSSGNIDGKSYGLGLSFLNMLRYHNLRFDAGFDLWKQGFNLLYYEIDNSKYREIVLSGKVYLKTIYQINDTISFLAQASYKGDGFLLGNPVKHGFGTKIGIDFYF